MPTVEERLAHVEGQVIEISQVLVDVRAAIRHLEQSVQRLEHRFDMLEAKMSRQFMWIVGIQITTLLTIITMLGAIVVTLLSRT